MISRRLASVLLEKKQSGETLLENNPVGEWLCGEEILCWTIYWFGKISSAGDELLLLVIMNPVGDWIFVCERNELRWGWFSSCDFNGDNLLDSTRDNPPESIGENYPNSTGDNFLVLMINKLCLGRILPIHSRLRTLVGESDVLFGTANVTVFFLLCGERMYFQPFSPTRSIPIPGG